MMIIIKASKRQTNVFKLTPSPKIIQLQKETTKAPIENCINLTFHTLSHAAYPTLAP